MSCNTSKPLACGSERCGADGAVTALGETACNNCTSVGGIFNVNTYPKTAP